MVFFAFQLLYGPALGLTKMSVAFMYFRILQDRRMHIVLWATQALNVLIIISFIISIFFACKPLAYYWTYSYAIPGGTCPDIWGYNGYYTGFNVFMDIWLIILPSHYIWKNILDPTARLGIIAMFSFGLMCAATILLPSSRSSVLTYYRTMTMSIVRFVEFRKDDFTLSKSALDVMRRDREANTEYLSRRRHHECSSLLHARNDDSLCYCQHTFYAGSTPGIPTESLQQLQAESCRVYCHAQCHGPSGKQVTGFLVHTRQPGSWCAMPEQSRPSV